jgi:hypothetical protein
LIDSSEWPLIPFTRYKFDFQSHHINMMYYLFFEKDQVDPIDFLIYSYFIDQPGIIHMW